MDGCCQATIDRFLDPKDTDVRSFVLSRLHSYLLTLSVSLSEQSLADLAAKTKSNIQLKLFLETNFLFSVLDLHDNPANTGASAIKCCYAAAGSGTGAEESGLRATVSRKPSIRDHKGIVVAKKMSRKVSRRVVRPACIAGVRISRPNFRAPCGRTKL